MRKQIPNGSMKLQEGLYLHAYDITINNITYTMRKLYAQEGYCFYDTDLDVYDEETKELLPRTHYQFMSLGINKSLDTIVCIPCTDDCEIA